MALQVKVGAEEYPQNDGFYALDLTLSYNSVTNITGYGVINPDIADFNTAVLTVTKPDPDTLLPSTDPAMAVDVDVYYGTPPGAMPNTTGAKQPISAVDDLGYAEKLQNGIYKLVLTLTDVDTTYTSLPYYFLVYSSLVCCITKQYLTINLDECGDCLKRDSAVWNTMLGQFYLNGAYYSWLYAVEDETFDFTKTAEYLQAVTNICNNCAPCGC